MSGIIPESPRYPLGSLSKHPDSSTLSTVDRHSQLARRQLPPALPRAQSQQQLAQGGVPTHSGINNGVTNT